MLKKSLTPLVFSLLALCAAPASAAVMQTAQFVDINTRAPIPNSLVSLTREQNQVNVNVQASGLIDGAYTVWFGTFNNPAACIVANACEIADFDNPAANGSVFRVSGGTIGTDGTAGSDGQGTFNATVQVGEFPDPNAVRFGPGLLDSFATEIHTFIRYHGPVIPGREEEQTTTFFGGCPPNECTTIQEATFRATPVPESTSVLGLLAFAGLGLGAMVKNSNFTRINR